MENLKKLTKKQVGILDALRTTYLTPKQIANSRGLTLRALQRIIKRIKEKGYTFEKSVKMFGEWDALGDSPPKNVRLHAQELNVKIVWTGEKYLKLIAKSNQIEFNEHTVRLFPRAIEIYSKKSFFGIDPQECKSHSLPYWRDQFRALEEVLGVVILKPRSQNVRVVKEHYSEMENELASDAVEKKYKIKVAGSDNIVWLICDDSFNLRELETVHPKFSKTDMQDVVLPFFNDLRHNESMLPSQVNSVLSQTVFNVNEIGAGLASVVKILQTIIPKSPEESVEEKPDEKSKRPDYVG